MKISVSSITHPGFVRDRNEDAVAVCPDLALGRWMDSDGFVPLGRSGALVVVADGMGGANYGDVASGTAVNRFRMNFSLENLSSDISSERACDVLINTFEEACSDILACAEKDPSTAGMGTTVVALLLERNHAHIAWCGDSRCYIYRPGQNIRAVTKDHSYVQELVDKGEIHPDQMMHHPCANMITRALGDVDVDSTPEISICDFSEGDMFLLCSDGLCGYCSDKMIESVMAAKKNNTKACVDGLLQLALQAGGLDNVSIAVVATCCDTESTCGGGFWSKLRGLLRRNAEF